MQLGSIAELGALFHDLCDGQADWSQATFGADAERGPIGPLKHLEKESVEAQDAWEMACAENCTSNEEGEKFEEEMADCLLLVLDAARRGGVTGPKLIATAMKKLEKNRGRKWGAASATEPVEHVE